MESLFASLLGALKSAVESGALLESAQKNIEATYEASSDGSVARRAIEELISQQAWTELNDRFYKMLAFGTGGIRGRTIGKIVTTAEQGNGGPLNRPEFSCIGTNAMNDANVERATRGLARYVKKAFPDIRPKIVFSHDTRHFSRSFAEMAARVTTNEGVDAVLFVGERSTPQLSFAVRDSKAQAGVMITASHNPPHDNGFKAYFEDGGQLVEPAASAVIAEVNAAVASAAQEPKDGATVQIFGAEADTAYLDALETLVLDKALLDGQVKGLNIVFTPIHGTGIQSVKPLFERLGIDAHYVAEQVLPDGRFPTVKSPNPENGEALALGIALAKEKGSDIVIATDPDADRMGVAIRNRAGEYELITGNQIGSIMAYYRVTKLVEQGVLTKENASRACLIKTFVTTELQAAIARRFGLKLVNTLTGFKYIGEKMLRYEKELLENVSHAGSYRDWPALERRALHLEKGCYFVFGGEESYGYSGGDYVRDKDANAAVLMMVEALAAAKASGKTLLEYLDGMFAEFGVYLESLGQITLEGAEGAAKIKRILESFQTDAPKEFLGRAVTGARNYAKDELLDVDGARIPKELMLWFDLADGSSFAVRGSGTEPKIKFYLYGNEKPTGDAAAVPAAKQRVRASLAELWKAIEADALRRAG